MADALSEAERLLATIVAARSRVAALTGDHHAPADTSLPVSEPEPPFTEPTPSDSPLSSIEVEASLEEDDDTAEVEASVVAPPSESLVLGLPDPLHVNEEPENWLHDPLHDTFQEIQDVTITTGDDRTDSTLSTEVEPQEDTPADHPPVAEASLPEEEITPVHVSPDPPEEDPFSFLDLIPPTDSKDSPKSSETEPSRDIPPIRPKPVMPLVAAMAAAAPPTLSAPRPVAPQILDPERQSLEVDVVEVEVEEDDEAHTEFYEPVPKLTDNTPSEIGRPPPSPQPSLEEVFDTMTAGLQALSTGNLHQAHALFSDAIDWDNERMDARIQRGRCSRDLGDLVGAMSDFLAAESISPQAPQPHLEMGDLFFARKDYERAVAHYSDALSRDPEHAMAHCRRGMCHHYQRRSDLALQDLQQAQKIDPEIPNIGRYVQMVANPKR